MLCACGATKVNKQKPLVSSSINKKVDSLAQAVKEASKNSIDSVVTEVISPDTLNNFPKIPVINSQTPEEKLVEQKRTGINKNSNWASAIHYDNRKPNYVIIHHTSQNSTAQTVRTFQLEHTKVSSHYVIGRDGQVIQMLNDYDRAWHAGRSKWGSNTDINSVSLGIELDNNGREPFADAQINSLLVLLDTLKSKYQIPQLNFIGHADIAPTRKDDPNVNFPWKRLAEHGFGIWYNEDFLGEPPFNFNAIDALKIMGYDMTNAEAAIRAFKRKYIRTEVNGVLTARDKAVLYDLYRKYY
ncbi:N-acetylmuramoyl-L-alanine amidase [Sphingobacterium sp. WQ 366]|uniref:N-acetylmuramoyl-L-alanine amidase n=2 Tax=Sphingobacterium bovistauri TaxID=2781959 RepID=A0ABS7ZD57_9SPHI|nr:N-acetylmuramoyl-L-alanine amidase [Sphingobacterium bovistauri]